MEMRDEVSPKKKKKTSCQSLEKFPFWSIIVEKRLLDS